MNKKMEAKPMSEAQLEKMKKTVEYMMTKEKIKIQPGKITYQFKESK